VVVEERTGSKIICGECDSDLLIDTDTCPICGTSLHPEKKMDDRESRLKAQVIKAYNLLYCAEYMDVGTTRANELIADAREEIEVGDLDLAEEMISHALEHVFEPLKGALKKELSEANKRLRKEEVFGVEVGEYRDLLKKAKETLEDGELDRCLILLVNLRKRSG